MSFYQGVWGYAFQVEISCPERTAHCSGEVLAENGVGHRGAAADGDNGVAVVAGVRQRKWQVIGVLGAIVAETFNVVYYTNHHVAYTVCYALPVGLLYDCFPQGIFAGEEFFFYRTADDDGLRDAPKSATEAG